MPEASQGNQWGIIVSFALFLLLFVGIGAYSATRASKTEEDYLVAGRSVSPWMTALSAVSTNNSGFMFIGLIGMTYVMGLSAMWLMIGWVAGDWLAWFFIHRPLRETSESFSSNTISDFLATDAVGKRCRPIAVVAGLIIVAFLGTYAAAQLNAGSKALHVLFGWPIASGAIIGAVIIVIYCFSGGIRASIWTDTAQAIVMLAAMLMLLIAGVVAAGGVGELWSKLEAINPALIDPIPQAKDAQLGFLPYALGWFGAGVGVIGQPHIMIRAMAIRSPDDLVRARRIYFVWYWVFSFACLFVGLACRVLLEIPAGTSFDSELALPSLAMKLLPAVFVGMTLAGIFAATMSTADSQVLACSASLTQDILPKSEKSYLLAKVGTVAVAAVALLIALYGSSNVFRLVTLAWSALASGLGPLMVVRVFKKPVSAPTGVLMMLAGIATILVWRYVLHLEDAVYDVFPGMVVGLASYFPLQAIFGAKSAT